MSSQFQSTNNLYGFPQALTRVFPPPIIAQRAPVDSDFKYPIGQLWVYEGNDYYGLVSVAGNSATWAVLAAISGAVDTLSDDSDTAVYPSAGNIQIAGTADEISSTAGSSVITLSFPDAITTPGSLTTTSGLAAGTTLSSVGATTLATTGASTNTFGNSTGATGITMAVGTGNF